MTPKELTKLAIRKLGYVVNRNDVLHSEDQRRRLLFEHHQIENVIDVGANEGQYGLELRQFGFSGKIFSFEPLTEVYSTLRVRADRDSKWEAYNMALGESKSSREIFISDNSQCSSLTKVLPRYQETAPRSVAVDKQTVEVSTLDSEWDELEFDTGNILLKLDVQGYEKMVLQGSQRSLQHVEGVQIELSIEEMYEGEMVFDEAINYLKSLGFLLKSLSPVHCDKRTGEIMQLDVTFFRVDQS